MATSTKKSASARVDCATCKARSNGFCAGYDLDFLRVIAGYKSCDRHVTAGQDLISVGEPCDAIYNLVDGWMLRYNLLADGRRQIFDFALPGAVLGFHPPHDAIMTYSVQALTDATVCVIPQGALGPLSRQNPEIGLRLAWLMSRDRGLAFDHLTSIGRRLARERVAHLLLELFVRCRAQWPGHRLEEMQLPLTQEHIGDATGLTGVHVSRVLGDLRNAGILRFSYRRLTILDPDRLVDEAGIDPELLRSWVRQPSGQQETVTGMNAGNIQPRLRMAMAARASAGPALLRSGRPPAIRSPA